jgi:hypothetical protein
MHERFEEKEAMEFVAEHAGDLITILKQSEGTSKVYLITYLLATVRDEAMTALSDLQGGTLLQNAKPQGVTAN